MEFDYPKRNGNTEDVKALNVYLKTLEQEVFEAQHQLTKDLFFITIEVLKNRLQGIDEKQLFLVPIFQDHNRKFKELVEQEYAQATLTRYERHRDLFCFNL